MTFVIVVTVILVKVGTGMGVGVDQPSAVAMQVTVEELIWRRSPAHPAEASQPENAAVIGRAWRASRR